MERAAAGDVGGGLPLNKAQQRSHMRKCLKEKVETPRRESVSQPGTTAKEPSKEASMLKPEPCRNKVKDLEEHVIISYDPTDLHKDFAPSEWTGPSEKF